MKKFLITVVVIVMLLCSLGFTNRSADTDLPYPVYKILEVSYLYEFLQSLFVPHAYYHGTDLKTGLRARYGMCKAYASIDILESYFEVPVFRSGPHQGDMNWRAEREFGFYNPEFISKMTESVDYILNHPTYKGVADYIYDRHLTDLALVYGVAYNFVDENKELRDKAGQAYIDYLNGITTELGPDYHALGEAFSKQYPQFDIYDADTAPYFWIRRYIDETDRDIVILLNKLSVALD